MVAAGGFAPAARGLEGVDETEPVDYPLFSFVTFRYANFVQIQ